MQFVVVGDYTEFDLNGHTLSSTSDEHLVILQAGYTGHSVINGTLSGSPHGTGVYIASCVTEADVPELQANGFAYEDVLYARCSKHPIVQNLHITGFNNGVYVAPYVTGAEILGNVFENVDNVSTYLDTGSRNALVKGNIYRDSGWRAADSPYARKREHVSIDASFSNTVEGNIFSETAYKWALYGGSLNSGNYPAPMLALYRNYGEENPDWTQYPVLPRLHGADNNIITSNSFNGPGLGVWIQYREHHNLSPNVIYPDKADSNVMTGNIFNGPEHVRDDGSNNVTQ